jgi:hypothetical protein
MDILLSKSGHEARALLRTQATPPNHHADSQATRTASTVPTAEKKTMFRMDRQGST